jgi:hypothetical protein
LSLWIQRKQRQLFQVLGVTKQDSNRPDGIVTEQAALEVQPPKR